MNRIKRVHHLKTYLLLLATLLFPTISVAQFLRTSYFMEGSHYRLQLNPALTPSTGYINLPVIGSTNASIGSTSLNYQDIINILDNKDHFYNNRKFLDRLEHTNNLNLNINTDILSAGWYKGANFWSFNIGIRTELGAQLTKSMFTFLNEMDQIENNWRNSNYNLSGQKVNINTYGEIGIGYARQINRRLSIGGRVKFLLGIGNMNLRLNNVYMNANLPSDSRINELENMTYATPSEINNIKNEINNYYANLTIDAQLQSSFKGLKLIESQDGYIDDIKFESNELGIAGYGLGIDIGASYKILNNLTISAAVLDLGFIAWQKDNTQTANTQSSNINIKGSSYTDGIDTNKPEESINIIHNNLNRLQTDTESYMKRVNGGDILNYNLLGLQISDNVQSRTTQLYSTLVAGAEYGFFNNTLSIGLLSTIRFIEPKTLTEITLSTNYHPNKWLNIALSYSAIQSSGKSFGIGFKLGALFLGTDYMFLGKNSNIINGCIGVSIPLNSRQRTCCCK